MDSENEIVEWVEESDSSVSDFDEDSSDWVDDSILIECSSIIKNSIVGYNRESKNEGPPTKKKQKLNEILTINESIDPLKIQSKWVEKSEYITSNVTLLSVPFQLCKIDTFISNSTVLNYVRDEFNRITWHKRRLDLYEYHQTDDLSKVKSKYIKSFYEFLKTDVMPWVAKATNLPLVKVSASCSCYSFTDYLLVHDDLQGDRCVAFIFYLTGEHPETNENIWKPEFGGSLQIFDKDSNGQPNEIVDNLYPSHNRFVFFQVNNYSHHQVAEVLTMNYSRLSINGWFHTRENHKDKPVPLPIPDDGLFGKLLHKPIENVNEFQPAEWIEPTYLEEENIKKINAHIEENSEIALKNYFLLNIYNKINDDLLDDNIQWKWVGPRNRRYYQVAIESSLPTSCLKLINFFKNVKFFEILNKYTDLDLVPTSESMPSMRYELQRWTPFCYSLMSETTWFSDNELDVIVYFGCFDGKDSAGIGSAMYVARGDQEQEALVTIAPNNNTLNIVYREADTVRIMPHIPQRSKHEKMFTLVCSYSSKRI